MLPKIFEKKLHKLMQLLKINCGSIDILVTPNDEFYFLEVNPIGQFQWLSKNCNYFIEQM
jgi:D-alanine-D-alanine ligase-like ATP-grasp enzyme